MQKISDLNALAESLFDELFHHQIQGQIDSDPEVDSLFNLATCTI